MTYVLIFVPLPIPNVSSQSLAPDHKRAVDAARARGVGVAQSSESLRRQQLVLLSSTSAYALKLTALQDPEAPMWGDKTQPKRPT